MVRLRQGQPAAGHATPALCEIAGREYVAIAAGGGKNGAPSRAPYVRFALPLLLIPVPLR